MAQDLTPEITKLYDTYNLGREGDATKDYRIRFYLGKFGPFEHSWDHAPSSAEISSVIAERKSALIPHV